MIQMIRTSWNAALGLVLFASLVSCPFSLSAQQMSGQPAVGAEQIPMQQANCSTPAAVFDPACVGLRNQNSALVPDGTPRTTNEPQFDFSSEERQQRLEDSAGRTSAIPTAQAIPVRPLPPEPPTDFQKFVESSIGQMLPLYGAQLFVDAPSTFAPVDQIPVTNDYVIGPGDELLVRAWGSITFNLRRTVDRNGYIYIPNIGQIQVSRLRFSEVHDFLQSQIGRVFQRFQLSVEMGRLRSVQVFVVGKARKPGTYTVSSLSTVVSTLFAAGGPSAAGSMRKIQLKRNGQVVAEVDLYNLLLRGDKAADIAILPGDIIYIPPAGPRIALAGSVSEPAIYEIKQGEDLGRLLEMEGGLTSLATEQLAQMERFDKESGRHIEDLRLDGAGLKKQLQDGDILWVRSMVPRFNDAVTLRGNVANPGRYAWKPGMHLRDLIPNQEILLTRQYWQQHNKMGVPSSKAEPTNTDVDTTKTPLTPDQSTPPAQRVASIAASSSYYDGKDDTKDKPMIAGLASKAPVGTQVPAIDWDYAVIERLNKEDLSSALIPFHLGRMLLQGDESQNLELRPGDIVTIFSQADVLVPQQRQRKLVRLEGEFEASGVYTAHPGETLRQLVARAGGLTPEAYLYGSSFARESTRVQQQARLDDYSTRLEQDIQRAAANKGGSVISPAEAAVTAATIESQRELITKMKQLRATGRIVLGMNSTAHTLADIPDIPLEDGDVFVVPSIPTNVSVIGAVYDQNSFLFKSTAKASDYLSLAGGYTRNADQSHMFVIRADGSVFSRNAKHHQGSVEDANLNPGDAVVVPERINKSTLLRGLTDWSSIFSQFALGAAAVNVIR